MPDATCHSLFPLQSFQPVDPDKLKQEQDAALASEQLAKEKRAAHKAELKAKQKKEQNRGVVEEAADTGG